MGTLEILIMMMMMIMIMMTDDDVQNVKYMLERNESSESTYL